MELSPLYYNKPRGQCAVLLLAAIRDLSAFGTKREAIGYISQMHWFAVQAQDLEPYRSQQWASREPRWHTLIAWARKDSVLRDLVSNEGRDMWGLTRNGRNAIDRCHERCRAGTWPVAPCFLWSVQFKRFLCPTYVPSEMDSKRPEPFYRGLGVNWAEDFGGVERLKIRLHPVGSCPNDAGNRNPVRSRPFP